MLATCAKSPLDNGWNSNLDFSDSKSSSFISLLYYVQKFSLLCFLLGQVSGTFPELKLLSACKSSSLNWMRHLTGRRKVSADELNHECSIGIEAHSKEEMAHKDQRVQHYIFMKRTIWLSSLILWIYWNEEKELLSLIVALPRQTWKASPQIQHHQQVHDLTYKPGEQPPYLCHVVCETLGLRVANCASH